MLAHPAKAQPHEVQIATDQVAAFSLGLLRALGHRGLDLDQIHQIFAKAVRVECPSCTITLPGQELARLVAPAASPEIETPKQRRIRLGYCPREGCDSRFVIGKLAPVDGLSWSDLLAQSDAITRNESADVAASEIAETHQSTRRRRRQALGITAGAIVVVLLWRWYNAGAYVPGISTPPRVFIVEADPDHPVPLTNQPRLFPAR